LGTNYSNYFKVIVFLLVLILYVNIETFFPIPSVSLHEISLFVEHHQGLISSSGIIISIFIFYLTLRKQENDRKRDENERMDNICNALLEELKDHRDAFTRNISEDYIKVQDITYINRVLNTNAYESVLHSGLFTYFDDDTQNRISNLYVHIIRRNQLLDYLNIYKDNFLLNKDINNEKNVWIERQLEYQKEIMRLESEIHYWMNKVGPLIKN
jgi:hypothetical protein